MACSACCARARTTRVLSAIDRRPSFAPGDKVRILAGAFMDSLGLFEGVGERERVSILLDLLGRKVRIMLDADLVTAA